MAAITDNAKVVFADGPSSNPKEPNKADIVRLFTLIEAILGTAVNGLVVGSAIVYQTRAALFADLNRPANTLGIVYGDSNPAYNGIYVKSGASGGGSWTLTNLVLPSTFAADLAAVISAQAATQSEVTAARDGQPNLAARLQALADAIAAGGGEAGEAIAALQEAFDAHKDDTANPHGVTKLQVGLGNVDNTADMDKPISTAQLQEFLTTTFTRLYTSLHQNDDDVIPGFSWAARMRNGAIPFGVDETGKVLIYALGKVSLAADDDQSNGTYLWHIDDQNRKIAFGIRRDGRVDARVRLTKDHIADIDFQRATLVEGQVGVKGDIFDRVAINANLDRVTSTVGGLARPYLQRKDLASNTYLFDTANDIITALWHMGQSNAGGAGESVVINAVPPCPQHAIMLNTGSTMGPTAVSGVAITDFVPALEAVRSDGSSETQGTSITSFLARKDRLTESPAGVYLYNSHAIGGKKIAELQKGSTSYANGLTALQRSIPIAASYGKQIYLPAILSSLGEGDASAGTSQAAFASAMQQVRSDYNADYLALLPAGHPAIAIIMDQLPASSIGLTAGAIALAQLELAEGGNGFYLSTPRYFLKMSPGDDVHMRAAERVILGEYQAKVWRRIFKDGVNWKPLSPASITRTGNQIVTNFNVPRGSLEWDFSLMAPARNYGFEYNDDSNSATISNVAITGPAQVTITLSGTPTGANKKVGYAYSTQNLGYGTRPGAWGNLRDQDDERSFSQPDRFLRNYCVTFRKAIS